MDKHLMSSIADVIHRRKDNGATTNVEALARAMEHGTNIEGYRDVLLIENFFTAWPVRSCGEAPSCWINPHGFIYSVAYSMHSTFMSKMGLSYSDAERQGWLHVSGGRIDQYFQMTPAQNRVVGELIARDEGYYINDKRGEYPSPKLEILREGLWGVFNARPTSLPRMDPDLAALCDLAMLTPPEPTPAVMPDPWAAAAQMRAQRAEKYARFSRMYGAA